MTAAAATDELLAVAFAAEDPARAAYRAVEANWNRGAAGLYALAFVSHDGDGDISVESPQSETRAADATVTPVLFGTFVGALLTVPVVGLALGGVAAAAFALTRSSGAGDDLRQRVAGLIPPGQWGTVIFATSATAGAMEQTLAVHGGTASRHPLTAQESAAIHEVI
jgi:uncharacterized membrane protein